MVLDAPSSARIDALALPMIPRSDAALGETPNSEFLASGCPFGVRQAQAGHLAVAGEAIGHARLHHLPIDGLSKTPLVENADDAAKLVLRFPNFESEALALRDSPEPMGGLPAEWLVVLRRVDGVKPNLQVFAGAAKPAEAHRRHAVAVLDTTDFYGEGVAAAEVHGATTIERSFTTDPLSVPATIRKHRFYPSSRMRSMSLSPFSHGSVVMGHEYVPAVLSNVASAVRRDNDTLPSSAMKSST